MNRGIALNERIATDEVKELCRVLAEIEDPEAIARLLEDLCTIREIQDFAQRLSVARMLDSGEPYTAISERTGASATTIARVSKALNYGAGGYAEALAVLEDGEDDGE